MAAVLALVIIMPTAAAQEMMDESDGRISDDGDAKTGGPSLGLLLLPTAALLAGAGLVVGYVVRRRS
ncbi:MAG: hypothetical protein M3N45_06760 [Actinomycetota bacterium]|nr:hypothetical protein [Actinomycetota bacterium]